MAGCIDANQALDFVDGRLTSAQEAEAEAHISQCDDCRSMIAQLAGGDLDHPSADEPELIGRYQIADELGSGGMGVVYRAYDPDLQRDVAIKLLHVGAGTSGTEAARARLLREAQGLAQLAHPNVVAVHDVGIHNGDVFVAMELVRGQTLRAWLRGGKRPTDEVLSMFIAAGRGLAAAHAAALVHRDFKPDNVMIGSDGRVRVLDFGLVLPTGVPGTNANQAATNDDGDSNLTMTGYVVGTPAYMAPEQHLDQAIDHRCDQFSFCVALYEALFGQAPFGGASPRERAQQVIAGKVREPTQSADAGPRVRAAVLRGLSRNAQDRHESMAALLELLMRPPRHAALWVGGILGVAAIAGIAMFIGMRASSDHVFDVAQDNVCKGGDERLAGVWDGATRKSIEQRFMASKRPGAALAFRQISTTLDRYRTDWLRTRQASCRATHMYQTQSFKLLDLRTQCLERRLLQMQSLTRFLDQATATTVDNADRLVRKLDSIASCADRKVLDLLPTLPRDPKQLEQLRQLYVTIGVAAHEITTGNYRDALTKAVAVAKATTSLGFKPLLAQAHFIMGEAQQRVALLPGAEKSFGKAVQLAAETKNDRLAAIIWANLILIKGKQYKLTEALQLETVARAAVTRDGNRPALRANLLVNLASVHLVNGDNKKALALFERALAMQIKAYTELARPVAATLINLATTYQANHRLTDSITAVDRAARIVRTVLGEHHPYMAQVLYTAARIHEERGKYDAASAAYRTARLIRERIMGKAHPLVAAIIERQAMLLARRGKLDEAHSELLVALAIKTRALGDHHPLVANVLEQLGKVLVDQGKHTEALGVHTRALKIRERAFGQRSINIVRSLIYVAEAAQRGRQRVRALKHFERALAILNAQPGYALVAARVQFALARLLYPKGNRLRAVKLAKQARHSYTTAGKPSQDQLTKVIAWLSRH